MFFSIYHPKGCGARDVSSSLYCCISYIISTCFSASRCKQTTSKSSPSWRSAHRKAEALSSGWSRHSFLRPGGGYLVTSFRDVQNFVFNVSKMWLHRPLSPWSFLLMQFGWPFKQIGDWGWKGRKGPLFSLVWFYQSGHVTSTVIPGHPHDLVRSC